MARRFVAGSTDKIVSGNTVATPAAVTIVCRFRPLVPPGSSQRSVVGLSGGTDGEGFAFIYGHGSASYRGAWTYGPNFPVIKYTRTFEPFRWYELGFTWDGATGRAYLNGVQDVAVTDPSLTTGTDSIRIGSAVWSSYNVESCEVANVAVWNTTFSDAQMWMLAHGRSPLEFAPGNLLGYIPLIGAEPPRDASPAVSTQTVTGTTAATDRPNSVRRRFFPLAGAGPASAIGNASVTLGAVTLASAGAVAVAAGAGITLAGATLLSAAAVGVTGSLAVTLGTLLLSSNNSSAARWIKRRIGIGISIHGN